MASSPSQPLRRQSFADDGGLTQSLSNLSLTKGDDDQGRQLSAPSRESSPSARRSVSTHSTSRRRESEHGVSSAGASATAGAGAGAGAGGLLRKASMNSLRESVGSGAPQKSLSRRSSHNNLLLSPSSPTATFSLPVMPEAPKPKTAASVAHDYFNDELEVLHGPGSTAPTDAVVILNDAVYGHRFSRPRTSRSALATIVERPERVRAAVLGISAAYVRLAERHSEGSVPPSPYTDSHSLKMGNLPFRIQKSTRTMPLSSPAVTNVHGVKWMEELTLMCNTAETKLATGGKELQRPEMDRGGQGPPPKLHEGDLYLCSESLNAMEGAMGAVCEAVDTVCGAGPRTAFVAIRPPGHHCSASYPSGFCWVNNVHVGIMHGFLEHDLTHAAIIDFDLHHGDGSQDITWKHNTRSTTARKNAPAWNKTSIGYFSLHDINSYPCEGGDEEKVKNASLCIDNAHAQNIWNVHLQEWKSEAEFWELYEGPYAVILEKTRKYLKGQAERVKAQGGQPKAAIFFSAGFDASEWESAGMQRHQVNVPTEFYARLGEDVVAMAAEEGLSVDGRVISVLEGGYSDRALCSGVMSHISGLVAKRASRVPTGDSITLGPQEQKIGQVYNPNWWSSSELDNLENYMIAPPAPPKSPRTTVPPTYSSPTQASTARVVEPIKVRRSFSGLSSSNAPTISARPPSPPPPEVPWTVAAHELSKILIPSERQTESCKPEDLNAEATKARRHRQSELGNIAMPAPPLPGQQPVRMSLRERKTKTIDEEDPLGRPKSRASGGDSVPVSPRKRNVTPAKSVPATPVTRRTQPGRAAATPSRTPRAQPAAARGGGRRLSGTSVALPPMKEGEATTSAAGADDAEPQGGAKLTVKKQRPGASRTASATRGGRGGRKPSAGAGPSAPRAATDELDGITSGMKKIKINLVTQSQREAKEKERAASSGVSTPSEELPLGTPTEPALSTPRLQTPTHLEGPYKLPAPQEQLIGASPMPFKPSGISAGAGLPLSSSGASTPIADQGTFSPTSIPAVITSSSSSPADASSGVDMFIPYQPEGPSPVQLGQTEPLKWLPPNELAGGTLIATPSPQKKKQQGDNLFKYVAGIPFAPKGQVKKEEENDKNWDLPVTPKTGQTDE